MKKQLFKVRPAFQIEATEEPLIARAGLVLPYEMAKALKLPQIIDQELPPAGISHGYRPSQFVMPLILMLHGGGKMFRPKVNDPDEELVVWPFDIKWAVGSGVNCPF